MGAQIASGLCADDAGVDAFAEAAARAALAIGGAPVDLAAVFAAAPNLEHAEEGLQAVSERLGARTLIGCGAQGVVGSGRELEGGGVAVWAARLPGARVESFEMEVLSNGDDMLAVTGMPELDDAEAMVMLVDPYSFPIEPVLREIGDEHPGLPVMGGLASAGRSPHSGLLIHDGEVAEAGAVGVTLGGIDVRPCVSQGARPIGPEMVVTEADENVIYSLASQPALSRLEEAIAELGVEERMLASRGLLLGIVIDENQPSYDRGDFLIRGLLSADEQSGALTVGETVRVGQTVRLHVRDGASADADLREALERERRALGTPPAGALVFTCNGRGSQMFDAPDHDAALLESAFGGAPAAGFFCAGEIGPVGKRNFLHGFTATVAVFPS